ANCRNALTRYSHVARIPPDRHRVGRARGSKNRGSLKASPDAYFATLGASAAISLPMACLLDCVCTLPRPVQSTVLGPTLRAIMRKSVVLDFVSPRGAEGQRGFW